MRDDTRHYSIEIRDSCTNCSVLLTAADWTEDEMRAAIAQIIRLAGSRDDNFPRSFADARQAADGRRHARGA